MSMPLGVKLALGAFIVDGSIAAAAAAAAAVEVGAGELDL